MKSQPIYPNHIGWPALMTLRVEIQQLLNKVAVRAIITMLGIAVGGKLQLDPTTIVRNGLG